MGRFVFIPLILNAVLASAPSSAQEVPGVYVWPIAAYTNISAGFCDYRTRHYHGGIDVSTNGQEGLPVRAADSGWIGRVSIGYWGYGKGVYLQMADGRMAVYGHLSELSEKIRDYVEDAQYRSQSYRQNLFPEKNQIPIARGEVIGRSGQTGAGPPHLHFEIRTGDNKPLNPLEFFDKVDHLAPSIYSVTITPIQPNDLDTPPSTVDGSFLPRTFTVDKGTIATTPHVTGAVGISVLADDHIDAPRWTMSAYRHRLIVNDSIIGEVRYDSINYDDTRQIEIERMYDPAGGIETRAVNLFRREGNTLWHYDGFSEDGILTTKNVLRPGTNMIRLEVEDQGGNQSLVEFAIRADSIPAFETGDVLKGISNTITWGGMVLYYSQPPDISIDSVGKYRLTHWIRGKDGWGAWLPASLRADVLWIRYRNEQPRTPVSLDWKSIQDIDGGLLTSADGNATVTFAAGDLYESGMFSLRGGNDPAKSGALTSLYSIAPRDIPFARDPRIQIEIPKSKIALEKLGVYRRQGRGWSFEGNARAADWNALTAAIKSAGAFAILADREVPTITNVTPARGAVLPRRQPTIRFTVTDQLSGIGSEDDLQMTIDDQWVPVEYDPDLGSAKARPRWELDPGPHRIEIVARDRCGNETRLEQTFEVR